jgi:hypothetical protein
LLNISHRVPPFSGFRGRVVRLSSAKAATAVRIRSEPQSSVLLKSKGQTKNADPQQVGVLCC